MISKYLRKAAIGSLLALTLSGASPSLDAQADSTKASQSQTRTSSSQLVGPLVLEERFAAQVRQKEPWLYSQNAETTKYEILEEQGALFVRCTKRGKEFFKRPVRKTQAEALHKLYQPSEHIDQNIIFPTYPFDTSLQATNHSLLDRWNQSLPDYARVSQATLAEGHATLELAGTNATQILQALELLHRQGDKQGLHLSLRSLPYLAKTNQSGEQNKVPDAQAMDAALFYENFAELRPLYAFIGEHQNAPPSFIIFERLVPWRSSSQEPLTRTRRHIAYALEDIIKEIHSPEEAFREVNAFAELLSGYAMTSPTDQSFYAHLLTHTARCEDQVNLVLELAKAIAPSLSKKGIFFTPIAIYTPAWVKDNGNHVFLGLEKQDANGKIQGYYTLNACDSTLTTTLDRYQNCDAAKLFAFTPFTRIDGRIKDITAALTLTRNLSFLAHEFIRKPTVSHAQLVVINEGKIKSVSSAPIIAGNTVFSNVGCQDYLFMVAQDRRGNVDVLTPPFIFHFDGTKTFLADTYSFEKGKSYTLTEKEVGISLNQDIYLVASWSMSKSQFDIIGGIETHQGRLHNAKLSPGVLYHLYSLLPDGSSYLTGRPFVIEDGQVVRY